MILRDHITGVLRALLLIALCVSVAACEEPVKVDSTAPPGIKKAGAVPGAAAGATPAAPAAQANGDAPEELDPSLAAMTFALVEDDFVELEANRDPFHSFAELFIAKAPTAPQRAVMMSMTTVDEMRLVAIVTGIEPPRVMISDKTGVGHVVRRGDYVGRPEVIQVGGIEGVPVTLNWRVEAIRPNEVVLTRDDPTSPNQVPISRRLLLHEGEPEKLKSVN